MGVTHEIPNGEQVIRAFYMAESGQGKTDRAMESLFGISPSRGRATDLPYLRDICVAYIQTRSGYPLDGIGSAFRSNCWNVSN